MKVARVLELLDLDAAQFVECLDEPPGGTPIMDFRHPFIGGEIGGR